MRFAARLLTPVTATDLSSPVDVPPAEAARPEAASAEVWDRALRRFVEAQAPIVRQVESELALGRKTSHWMWFVFPQLATLGRSVMARRYGLESLDEARAYAAHPVLGPRLRRHVAMVLAVRDRSAHEIFGSPDDLKFRSCLTLFERADPTHAGHAEALARYYDGVRDVLTLRALPRA